MAKVTFPYRGTTFDAIKTGIGFTNVNNTSDLAKPLSDATKEALKGKQDSWALGTLAFRNTINYKELVGKPTTLADIGITDTFATLVNGTVPASQLPSYVDDILEFTTLTALQSATITDGAKATGKIYITTDTGKIYRWGGSQYVDISSKVDSVNGKTGAIALVASDIGLGNVSNTSDIEKPISTATQTALNNKVTIVSGKGLSTNDYTDIDKRKLAELPNGWAFGALSFRNTINYSELVGIPTTFSPGTHYHVIGDVTDLQTNLNNKVTVVPGKGLSSNDYTDSDKNKVNSSVQAWMLGALAFRNTVNYSELLDKPTFGSLASKNSVTLSDISGLTGTASGTTYLRGDNSWSPITLPSQATSTTNGIVKLGSDTPQTIGAASPSTVTGKTYPIQLDSANSRMVVNVPWTDTVPTFSTGNAVKSFSVTVNGSTSSIPVYGIDNVDNTSDANKPISTATKAALTDKTSTWMLGALAFRNTVSYSELVGVPATFAPTTHTHSDYASLSSSNTFTKGMLIDVASSDAYLKLNRGSPITSAVGFELASAGGTSWTNFVGMNDTTLVWNYGSDRMSLSSAGNLDVNGYATAAGFKTTTASSGFLKANGTIDTSSYLTSATASTTVAGLVKLGSDAKQVISANAVSSDSGRTYAVQLDSINSRMVVNVPWVDTDTNTTYTFAEGTTNGAFNVTPSTTTTATPVTVHGLGGAAYKSDTYFVASTDGRLSDSRTPTYHEHTFSSLTSKPTSLLGYGITDSLIYKTGDTFTGTVGISPTTGSSYLVNTRSSISTGEVGIELRTTGSTSWYLYSPTSKTNFSLNYNGDKFSLDTSGNLVVSGTITSGTKLAILEGDTRLTDARTPTTHSHIYAGSSSAGGAADSVANALSFKTTGSGNTADYNGAAARTISYDSIGAFPAAGGTISGDTSVSGKLSVVNTFTSSASAIFSSDLTVSSGIFKVGTSTISGSANGATSLAGNLSVAGNLSLSGQVRVISADFSANIHTNRTFFTTNHATLSATRVCSAAKDGVDNASSGFMAYGKSSTSSGSSPYINMVSNFDGTSEITFDYTGSTAVATSLAIGSTGATNAIYILGHGSTNAGRVGIGTNNPGEMLDVAGNVNATGFKTTSGTSAMFLKANGTTDTTAYLSSVSGSNFASQTANYVLAAPNGSAGTPTFRALASADLPTASTSVAGVAKLGSDTSQTIAANSVSATTNRTYAIQFDSNKQMVVNVPWVDTDTNTTYSAATTSVAGLVKLGDATVQSASAATVGTTAGRTYPIQLNGSSQMVVNVPWTDTNSGGTITGVSASTTNQTIYGITIGASTTNNVTTLSLSGQLILPTTAPSLNIGACYCDGTKFWVRVSATAWKSVTLV